MSTIDFITWAGFALAVLGFPAIYKLIVSGVENTRDWITWGSHFPRLEVEWLRKGKVLRVRNADRHPIWSVSIESDPMKGHPKREIAIKLEPGEATEVTFRVEERPRKSLHIGYRCVGIDRFAPRAARLGPHRRGGDSLELWQIVSDPGVGLETRRATYMTTGEPERKVRSKFRAEVKRQTRSDWRRPPT